MTKAASAAFVRYGAYSSIGMLNAFQHPFPQAFRHEAG
jgi:hypothetical protein